MKNIAALGTLVLITAGVLVMLGAAARVMWWLVGLGWSVL